MVTEKELKPGMEVLYTSKLRQNKSGLFLIKCHRTRKQNSREGS